MSTTLATLRTRAKTAADLRSSNFVTDADWLTYINVGLRKIYALLAEHAPMRLITSATLPAITSGNTTSMSGVSVLKILGLDKDAGTSTVRQVLPFEFGDRHNVGCLRYIDRGSVIEIQPEEAAPGTYTLWYIPRVTLLSGDSDAIPDELDAYDEFIVQYARSRALSNRELDVGDAQAQMDMIVQELKQQAPRRQGDARGVRDVMSVRADAAWWWHGL